MKEMIRLTLAVFGMAVMLTLLGETDFAQATDVPYGSVVGRVEIVPGIPLTSDFGEYRAVIDGLPNGTYVDEYGNFKILRVPFGVRTVMIYPPEGRVPELPPVRRVIGITSSAIFNAGAIVFTKPGSVTGRITLINTQVADLATLVVAIPEFGLVTKPNADGGYLLTGVPPGTCNVRLIGPGLNASRDTYRLTYIVAGNPTVGVDFVIRGFVPSTQIDPSIPQNVLRPNNDENVKQNAKDPAKKPETPAEADKRKAMEKVVVAIPPIKKP
jgi:hypothetical protein